MRRELSTAGEAERACDVGLASFDGPAEDRRQTEAQEAGRPSDLVGNRGRGRAHGGRLVLGDALGRVRSQGPRGPGKPQALGSAGASAGGAETGDQRAVVLLRSGRGTTPLQSLGPGRSDRTVPSHQDPDSRDRANADRRDLGEDQDARRRGRDDPGGGPRVHPAAGHPGRRRRSPGGDPASGGPSGAGRARLPPRLPSGPGAGREGVGRAAGPGSAWRSPGDLR